jgi:HSP20 family molecular chaperone IbpA
MWSEALDLLARAERMHREVFSLRPPERSGLCWEPPVDMLETDRHVIVLTAMPGVDPGTVSILIEDGDMVISGERSLPSELQTATIHRLELPQGCFRRRVRIPPGTYDDVERTLSNGCLIVTLRKTPGGQ